VQHTHTPAAYAFNSHVKHCEDLHIEDVHFEDVHFEDVQNPIWHATNWLLALVGLLSEWQRERYRSRCNSLTHGGRVSASAC
jgi:hypothetical protein